MDFMFRSLILVPVFLTGCSAVDKTIDYFTTSGDASEIETAAAKNIAAAAQSDNPESTAKRNLVAGVTNKIADETAAMIDRNLGNSRTSISVTGLDKGEGSAEIKNVTGLTMGSNDQRQTFFQGGLKRDDDRTTVNLGIGQRYLSDDETSYTGVNAFIDYDADYGHQRASIGAEFKTSVFEMSANSYRAISDWEAGKNGVRERALDGYDIEIGGQLPYMPGSKLYLKKWQWDLPDTSNDVKGYTYSLAFNHVNESGFGIEVGRKDFDGLQTDENFLQVTYNITMGGGPSSDSGSFFSDRMFESTSMRMRLLDDVRRNNAIVVQAEFTAAVGGV